MFLIFPFIVLPIDTAPVYTESSGFNLKGQYYHSKQKEDWKDSSGYLKEALVSGVLDKLVNDIQLQDWILKQHTDTSALNDKIEFTLIAVVLLASMGMSYYLKRKVRNVKRLEQRRTSDQQHEKQIRNSHCFGARPNLSFEDSKYYDREL